MKKEIKFPEWKGYSSITDEEVEFVKKLNLEDIDFITRKYCECKMREMYLHDILCFIQYRLEKKIFDDEELGLCLNSAKELFGIMIVPCEVIKNEERR